MKERNVELEYQRVTKADLPIMIALYDEYLNGGDSSTEHLRKAIAEDGYIGVKCVDKAQGDRFVGVFSCLPGICFTYDHPELEAFVESRWGGTKLYSGGGAARVSGLWGSPGADEAIASGPDPRRGGKPAGRNVEPAKSGGLTRRGDHEITWGIQLDRGYARFL